MRVVIGSRGSDLALWQANFIKGQLLKAGIDSEIKIIKTQGDKIQNIGFDKLEGKGFFTKELEDALLSEEIDLAVHSHKDLPTTNPAGLTIAAVSQREDPSELLIIRQESVDNTRFFRLKENAVVGTSSARRKSQILSFRKDLSVKELRGNVPTRVQKLRDKEYDAILLAFAGIERLGLDLSEFASLKISPKLFIPAPAQGALALQVRECDAILIEKLSALNNPETENNIAFERKILNLFDGGCQLPLGVFCYERNDHFYWHISKAKAWNSFPIRIFGSSPKKDFNPIKLAEKTVKKITSITGKRVLITREGEINSYFRDSLSENGFHVTELSFIKIIPTPFEVKEKPDWILFSSKNAARLFLTKYPLQEGTQIAVVGSSTAQIVRQYGYEPSFCGEGTNTEEIACRFASFSENKKILFPTAELNSGVFQKALQASELNIVPVYKTEKIENLNAPESDIIVFTSPSNVESFFYSNKIGDSKIVAIGKSTQLALQKLGVSEITVPITPDEIGLAEAVYSI